MEFEKYIAVPVDKELLEAIENGCRESGLKLGPEAARRLRKSYRVGFFAPKKKEVCHEDANSECHQDVAADGSDGNA